MITPAPAHLDPAELIYIAELSEQLAAARAKKQVAFTSALSLPRRMVAYVANLNEQQFAALGTRPERRALNA